MKHPHLPSYLFGLGAGILVIFLFLGGSKLLNDDSKENTLPAQRSASQAQEDTADTDNQPSTQNDSIGQRPGRTMSPERLQGIAEQLGMTVEELQTEIGAGKNPREIAEERGIELTFGGNMRGSGAVLSGSGVMEPGAFPRERPTTPPTDENAEE